MKRISLMSRCCRGWQQRATSFSGLTFRALSILVILAIIISASSCGSTRVGSPHVIGGGGGGNPCDDGNPCTNDILLMDGIHCIHQGFSSPPDCCLTDAECDDGNACTDDFCKNFNCARTPKDASGGCTVNENGTKNCDNGLRADEPILIDILDENNQPTGDDLVIDFSVADISPSTVEAGTPLGVVAEGTALVKLQITGTGSLSNYLRSMTISSPFIFYTENTNGTPLQTTNAEIYKLDIDIPNSVDPDFEDIRFEAGASFGLQPSTGTVVFTALPGNNWNIESFFDITYRIEFVGAGGGPLDGRQGSSTGAVRLSAGTPLQSCDDGIPCTTDGCLAGNCTHATFSISAAKTDPTCCTCTDGTVTVNIAEQICKLAQSPRTQSPGHFLMWYLRVKTTLSF